MLLSLSIGKSVHMYLMTLMCIVSASASTVAQPHCKEISIYVFQEKELRGLSPNFHIHVPVDDLYIPPIGPPIFLQQNRQTDLGNTVYKSYTET
jgi:hypothetical protein